MHRDFGLTRNTLIAKKLVNNWFYVSFFLKTN